MTDLIVSGVSPTGIRATSTVDEGGWITTVARVVLPDGGQLMQIDCDSIELRIFNRSKSKARDTLVANGTLVVADVVFDTLQTDSWWDVDLAGGQGYNFRHTLQVGESPWQNTVLNGGEKYQLEYTIRTGGFGPVRVIHVVDVLEVLSQ
jgi:hypothetical protein